MTVLCMRCAADTKILRPQRCVAATDGTPCSACTEDIELERAIKELENRIEEMHAKRRALRTVMNEHHDQLIAKLPPEISSQIFVHYAPPDESFDENAPSPLYLGAVCRKWRQLAWRTPQLWSFVFIEFKRPYPSQLLADYLERSASLPLTLSLHPQAVNDDRLYVEIINVLNRHSSRWDVLYINLPTNYLHLLCGSPEENILRRLVLRPSDRGRSRGVAFSMKCKPSPIHLTLAECRIENVDIVWNHLTTASMEEVAVDECLELMRRAPLLETLTLLRTLRSSGAFPIPTARIILPHLRELAIEQLSNAIALAQILDSMCAPLLKEWKHSPLEWQGASILRNMVSFIEESSMSLNSLSLGGDIYDNVHKFLRHLPSLKSLQLLFARREGYPTNELLDLLCASNESSPFLPHLQLLEFRPRFFPWESLPRIFSSPNRRSMMVKIDDPIRSHSWSVEISNETADKLLELIDEGISLCISKGKFDVLEERRKRRHLSQTTRQ